MVFNPVLPQGGFHTLSEAQIAEWNRRAEVKDVEMAKIRKLLLWQRGLEEDGKTPLPKPDAAEEQRLLTTDLRAPLREARADRAAIRQRLSDRQGAADRAQAHLDLMKSELAELEAVVADGSRIAADELAERLRSAAVGPLTRAVASTHDLGPARQAVEVAERALDTITGEVEAIGREHAAAQHRVDLCIDGAMKADALRCARRIEMLEAEAAQERVNLQAAGYARVPFTASMQEAVTFKRPELLPPPPASTVHWQDYRARLDEDPDAELKQGD